MYEDDDDAGSAGALFEGGGFGFMALGSWPCPEAAARDASVARRAPSVSPSRLKTSSFTLGSRFGAIFSCQANLPRCASCDAYAKEYAIFDTYRSGRTTPHC